MMVVPRASDIAGTKYVSCGLIKGQSRLKIQHWTMLAENYMGRDSMLPDHTDTASILDLICKEEMNAFCLYPKATGGIAPPGPHVSRGRTYGLAFYTRGTLMNHDCIPNVRNYFRSCHTILHLYASFGPFC